MARSADTDFSAGGRTSRPEGAGRVYAGRWSEAAPDVASILDVDREYRAVVAKTVANEAGPDAPARGPEPASPVLRTRRRQWRFVARYSGSDACHALHRDRDWVVVNYDDDAGHTGRVTVVTAMRGPIRGRRILRSAEAMPRRECATRTATAA